MWSCWDRYQGFQHAKQYSTTKKVTSRTLKSACSLLLCVLQMTMQVQAGTQFASHVRINTPARSFSHGVGDPVSGLARRLYPHRQRPEGKILRRPPSHMQNGYPRVRPTIPFNSEEVRPGNSLGYKPWNQNNYRDIFIPLLPPSPYKVDSPDPESLWPEGLFLPPTAPLQFRSRSIARADGEVLSEQNSLDPFLLEGSEAIAAVTKANRRGHLYFHEIPHIESLLTNQELRIQNRLKPHRLGSIRHTWPYNRP